jgi:predicted RNase H-like nuclease (RuvC/YqgF family)
VKEKLAEGLHLIDFEQLKIENQTLNEKIEERNDELHKLKKKTTTTVQVLTHIKEKLQCVREENTHSQGELRAINAHVQNLRDQLTKTKHVRDDSRQENQQLKQKQGFIGSDLLVSDFENRKGDIDLLRAKVEGLKAKWRALNTLSIKATSVERTQGRMENQATLQRQSHYATVKFGAQNGATVGAATGSALRR